MIRISKTSDERREAGAVECWCLHGAVGLASDWRGTGRALATHGVGSKAVDLWRFLDCCPMPMEDFGVALSAEASGEVLRGSGRVLVGYSMGGRLALHALLADPSPWQGAVIVSAHPGLEHEVDRVTRRAADADWASRALTGNWAEFIEAWNAQPVFTGTGFCEDGSRASRLAQRRREIARSFVDWSLGAQEPLWSRLSGISIPVMWITGREDAKFTELAARAAASMPCASHRVIDGAGHRVPWQNETQFCAEVVGFLRKGCDAT